MERISETRTEADFVGHLRATVATDPEAEWVFIADQLNTHKSAGLVRLIAELCGGTPLQDSPSSIENPASEG